MPIYYTSTNFTEEDLLYCVIGPYNKNWHEFDPSLMTIKNLAGNSFPDAICSPNCSWDSKGSFILPGPSVSLASHGILCCIDQKDFFPMGGCTTLEITATCYADNVLNGSGAVLFCDYDSGGFGYMPKDGHYYYWGEDMATGNKTYRQWKPAAARDTCDGLPHTYTFQTDNADPNKTMMTVYIDGVLQYSEQMPYRLHHGSAANTYLCFGSNPGAHTFAGNALENLHGKFHDCIIYNRKLTEAEIKINYLYHMKIKDEII